MRPGFLRTSLATLFVWDRLPCESSTTFTFWVHLPENAKANVSYAFFVGLSGRVATTRRHGELAVGMAHQLGDPEAYAYCRLHNGTALEFAGANVEGQKVVRAATADVIKYCTALDASSLIAHVALSLVFQGKSRQAIDWCNAHLQTMKRLDSLSFQCGVWGALYSQYSLLGQTNDALKAQDEHLRIAGLLGQVKHSRAAVLVNAMMVMLDREDLGSELDGYARDFLSLRIEDYHRRYGYVLIAWIRLDQLRTAPAGVPHQRALAVLEEAIVVARPRARGPVHRCHVLAPWRRPWRESKDVYAWS